MYILENLYQYQNNMFRPFMAIIRFCPYQLRLYSETLIGTDKTWWWPWMPETCCFDIDINFQDYTSFTSYELCYWLPSHIDTCTTFGGGRFFMSFLNVWPATDSAALSRNTCEWRDSIEDGLNQKLQARWSLTFSVRNCSVGVRNLLCVCCV